MSKVIDIQANEPHKVSEVICVKCHHRWICVRPSETLLTQLECKTCGCGFVIETGQEMSDEEKVKIYCENQTIYQTRIKDFIDHSQTRINELLKLDPLI